MFRKIVGLLTLALTLPLAACDDGTTVASPGTMSLMLTDEEGAFTQAWVTISRIELAGDADAAGETEVLLDTPFTTNLLTLSNDIAALTEDVTVPGGTYSQLRFIIPEACIGVEQADGSEWVYASAGFDACDGDGVAAGSLQLPSFDETGLKVNLPGGAIEVDGDQHIILLDFHVSESFGQQAGTSGMWVMTPVIRAEDISLSGSLTVELTTAAGVDLSTVGSSLADFEARLDGETEPVAFTDEDEDGVFTATFLYLIPDDYEVSVLLQEDASASFTFTLDPASPQNVTLGSAADASIAFEVTAAS